MISQDINQVVKTELFQTIKDDQTKVKNLLNVVRKINEITDKKAGTFKVKENSELQKLFIEAQNTGFYIEKTEGDFSDKEISSFVENIGFYIADLGLNIDRMLQKVTHIVNEDNLRSDLSICSNLKKTANS